MLRVEVVPWSMTRMCRAMAFCFLEAVGRAMAGPGLAMARAIVSGLLRRRRRGPGLQEFVIIDRLALRLLVRQLALRRQIAVLRGFLIPIFRGFLRVHLRSERALSA